MIHLLADPAVVDDLINNRQNRKFQYRRIARFRWHHLAAGAAPIGPRFSVLSPGVNVFSGRIEREEAQGGWRTPLLLVGRPKNLFDLP